jgi:hypothetical protein
VNKIELKIIGLSSSHSQTGSYALVLGEIDGERRIPIIIGMFEAQSIALEMEQIPARRPMTHDLFKTFAEDYSIQITEVYISKLKEGVFYTEIHTSNGLKESIVDSRPSDAVALALRFDVPIYTNELVMSEGGIIIQNNEIEEEEEDITDSELDDVIEELEKASSELDLSILSPKELEKKLDEAIENEDYEAAANFRDELSNRES